MCLIKASIIILAYFYILIYFILDLCKNYKSMNLFFVIFLKGGSLQQKDGGGPLNIWLLQIG